MPLDRGATRPGRGSYACDEAYSLEIILGALDQHELNMGSQGVEVKQSILNLRLLAT